MSRYWHATQKQGSEPEGESQDLKVRRRDSSDFPEHEAKERAGRDYDEGVKSSGKYAPD